MATLEQGFALACCFDLLHARDDRDRAIADGLELVAAPRFGGGTLCRRVDSPPSRSLERTPKKSLAPSAAQLGVPRMHQGAQPHYEQHWVLTRCAERLVGDPDATAGHSGGLHPGGQV